MSAASLFTRTDRELWLLTAAAGGRRGGLIATFVSEASIVPDLPRVVVGIAKQHHTHALIEAAGAFALHLIGEGHLDWVWQFGLRSGRELDKLAGLSTTVAATGSPILADALGWLDCRVEARLSTGDRTVYLAAVVREESVRGGAPLTARRLIELAPPQYLRELKEQMTRDIAIDEAAIRAWRATHDLSPLSPVLRGEGPGVRGSSGSDQRPPPPTPPPPGKAGGGGPPSSGSDKHPSPPTPLP
jgi:flavin reductase (DIM6/NTAB) family NADH-FMN oxidoreductase RutF